MASVGDDKLGTRGEFQLRDDDRPNATGYRRRRGSTFGLVFLAGLIVAGLFVGYGALHRGERQGPEQTSATAGSTR
jgi:hypothetical protein